MWRASVHGAQEIRLVNRTPERAARLAAELGASIRSIAWDKRGEALAATKYEERGSVEDHGRQAEGRRNQHESHQLSRAVAVHVFEKAI